MTAIAPRGWCPSLYDPMATGDGLLVRVKPPRATLPAEAARRLAEAALRFGNGMLDLTSRGAIQVRGLAAAGVAPFAAAMVAAGLADPDPAVERRRSVICPPLDGAGAQIACEIETVMTHHDRLGALPPKFCVAVDVADVRADIVVRGEWVAVDGSPLAAACDRPAGAVVRLAVAFVALADPHTPKPRRMRALVDAVGAPAVFAAAGLRAATLPLGAGASLPADPPLVAPPFGSLHANTLSLLADLSEQHGDGTLRVTPWRGFLLPGAAGDAVRRAAADLGMIVDAADPRRHIVACPGRPACASATVDTRADAARLARLGPPGTVHVSGCAKGCAHPAAARLTLVGEGGRYGIVPNGRPGDPPARSGLTIAQVAAILDQGAYAI